MNGGLLKLCCYLFQNVMARYHKAFLGYDQHDAHEFLIKLMDWLHDDLNKVTVFLLFQLVS